MSGEENREKIEALIKSDYATYLLSEKAQDVIENKWKTIRWFVGGLVTILTLLSTWFGIHISNVSQEYDKELALLKEERNQTTSQLDTKTEYIRNKVDSLQAMLSQQNGAISSQEKQLNFQDKTITQSLNFSNLYSDLFKDQLQQTIQLRSNTEKDIAKFAKLETSIDSTASTYNTAYLRLTSLHDSIKSQIQNIAIQNNRNMLNASIRYVYAERSDREKATLLNAYKPSTIVLPNKIDTLTFIFYSALKKGSDKSALVDVYLGKTKHNRSPIEITEKNGVLSPTKIDFETPNDSYLIEPVFLYFPPNISAVLIIPDFIVLKIGLKDEADN